MSDFSDIRLLRKLWENSESEATAGEGDFGRFPEQKNSAAACFYYFLSILSSDFLCLGSLYQCKDPLGDITVCGGTPLFRAGQKISKICWGCNVYLYIQKYLLYMEPSVIIKESRKVSVNVHLKILER